MTLQKVQKWPTWLFYLYILNLPFFGEFADNEEGLSNLDTNKQIASNYNTFETTIQEFCLSLKQSLKLRPIFKIVFPLCFNTNIRVFLIM